MDGDLSSYKRACTEAKSALSLCLDAVRFELDKFGHVSLESRKALDESIDAANSAYASLQAKRLAGS